MTFRRVFRENWLTRKPLREGLVVTLVLVTLLVGGTYLDLGATPKAVFERGEYWRAWSALFAHANPAHLLSNLVLFIPFAFALTRHYSLWFFPVAGFAVGGLMNFLVLRPMSPHHILVGASGVVYWMGAAWVTLAYFVDRRERAGKRMLKAIGVSMLLFLPETYRPEVSYYAHFLGYASGVASALIYYAISRRDFHSAEVYETVLDVDTAVLARSIFVPVYCPGLPYRDLRVTDDVHFGRACGER